MTPEQRRNENQNRRIELIKNMSAFQAMQIDNKPMAEYLTPEQLRQYNEWEIELAELNKILQ